LTLDVIFLGINIASGKTSSMEAILERLLFMGFLVYIVTNFTQLSTMFKDSFIKILGGGTVGVPGFSSTIYHDPSQIISWAHDNMIAPMNEAIKKVDQAYTAPKFSITQAGQWLASSEQHMMDVWNVRLIFNLVFLGILLSFIIIAVEMTVAIIEFYLILLFSLVLVPFVAWQPLRFIGTRAFTAVIAQALKLGIIVAVISLGMRVMNNINATILQKMNPSDINSSLDFSLVGIELAACAVIVFLSIQVPALTMSLISGNPALSASGFGQNMMGIAAIGTAAIAGFRSIGASSQSSYRPTSPQPSYATNASGSSSVSSGPTSAGTPPGAAQNLFATAVGAGPSPSRSAAPVSGVNPVSPG